MIEYNNKKTNDKQYFLKLLVITKKTNDKQYFFKFNKEVVTNEETVRCIYDFPIETYVLDGLFQLHCPTDDILYQDLKEYNKEIEWNFIESYVRNMVKKNIKYPQKYSLRYIWRTVEKKKN